jgi:SAM-dependent methyltransferase
MTVRSRLGRLPGARSGRDSLRATRAWAASTFLANVTFERLPPSAAVELAYQVMLGRRPDPVGYADMVGALAGGRMSRKEMVQFIRGSEEFTSHVRFSGSMLGHSIHSGRCQFIRSLPRARRIVDLGGTSLQRDIGAMVSMGYPYPFDELVIVDLPSEDRHAIYRSADSRREVESPLGPVRYQYHSMTDLSSFDDGSVDLVYSGQSIEHVTPGDGELVMKEVYRVLRPGGYFALDTPNARVTRLQQAAFIDPDHEVEYTYGELRDRLLKTGFEITDAKGINYAGRSLAAGRFDLDDVAGNSGLYAAIDDCYILCLVAQKPGSTEGDGQFPGSREGTR